MFLTKRREKGLHFQVVRTLQDDANDPTQYKTPSEYVADTAYMKAKEVFDRCQVSFMPVHQHNRG